MQLRMFGLNVGNVKAVLISENSPRNVAGLNQLVQSFLMVNAGARLEIVGPCGIKSFLEKQFRLTYASETENVVISEQTAENTTHTFDPVTVTAHSLPNNTCAYFVQQPGTRQVNVRKARADGFPFGLLVKKLRNFEDVEVDGKVFRAADYAEMKGVVEFYFGSTFGPKISPDCIQFLEKDDF